MKKTLLITTLITIFSNTVFADKPIPPKEELLPEVKALFDVKPLNQNRLKDNYFIQAQGLLFPKDNWQTIYGEILIKNDPIIMKDIVNQKLPHDMSEDFPYYISIKRWEKYNQSLTQFGDSLKDGEKMMPLIKEIQQADKTIKFWDVFPCQSYLEANCVSGLLKQRNIMKQFIAQNRVVLDRFQISLRTSDHFDYIDYIEPKPYDFSFLSLEGWWTHHQIFLTHLMFIDLVFTLEDQDYTIALSQLELILKQRQIWMNESSNHTLISSMINVAMRSIVDHYLNELLTVGYLDSLLNEPAIQQLFAPYPKTARNTVINPLIAEFQWSYLGDALRPYLDLNNTMQTSSLTLNDEDEFKAINYLMALGHYIPPTIEKRFDELKTNTKFAYPESWSLFSKKSIDEYVDKKQQEFYKEWELLTKIHHDYFQQKNISLDELLAYFKQNYSIIPYLNESYKLSLEYQKVLLNDDFEQKTLALIEACHKNPAFIAKTCDEYRAIIDYIHRYEEQVVYHNLVYLKYRIMKDKIKDKDIPAFLVSQSEYTKHPLRDEIVKWNPEKRTLSIPLAKELNYLPAGVRLLVSQKKDESTNITHYEVSIPKQ